MPTFRRRRPPRRSPRLVPPSELENRDVIFVPDSQQVDDDSDSDDDDDDVESYSSSAEESGTGSSDDESESVEQRHTVVVQDSQQNGTSSSSSSSSSADPRKQRGRKRSRPGIIVPPTPSEDEDGLVSSDQEDGGSGTDDSQGNGGIGQATASKRIKLDSGGDSGPVKRRTQRRKTAATDVPEPAVQKKRSRRSKSNNGRMDTESSDEDAHEPGIIERMRLENFMCHNLLEVDFCNHVNIITGANGSGKSAILSGLQVALGARASSTHRGNRMSDMIKTDRDYAVVTVQLRNRGRDSYMPEIYGNSIIIERRLTRSGGGTVKIKSSRGSVVATRSRDLKLILNRFNILIDNPTTIMTQDVSRKFLAESKPTAKYEFFMRATQLQSMMDYYTVLSDNSDSMQQILSDKKDILKESERELKRLEAEYHDAQKMEVLESKITELNAELSWATVISSEQKLDKLRSNLQREQQHLKNVQNEESQGETKFEQLQLQKKEINEQVEVLNAKLAELLESSRKAEEKLRSERQKQKMMKLSVDRTYRRGIAAARQQVQRMEKEIEELKRQRNTREIGKEIEELENHLRLSCESLDETRTALQGSTAVLQSAEQEASGLEAQISQLATQRKREEEAINNARNDISNMKAARNDRLKVIHASFPETLRIIEQQRGKFRKTPIGPIGFMIKLKDDVWSLAAEHSMRSLLQTFIVDNIDDQKLLNGILHRRKHFYVHVVISAYSNKKYNVTRPGGGVPSLADMVEMDWQAIESFPVRIKDTLQEDVLESTVFNTLVDQGSIERHVLLQKRSDCYRYLSERHRNVDACFTAAGENMFMRGRSSVAVGFRGQARFFVRDVQTQIDRLERAIEESERSISRINEEAEEVTAVYEKKVSEVNSMRQRRHRQFQSMKSLELQVEEMQSEISTLKRQQEEMDNDAMVRNIEDRVVEKKQEIAVLERKMEEADAQLAAIGETIAELELSSQSFESDQSQLSKEHVRLHDQMRNVLQSEATIARKKESRLDLIAKIDDNITQITDSIVHNEQLLKEFMDIAVRMQPERVETERGVEEIAREKEHISVRISKEQERFQGRDLNRIKQDYNVFKKSFDSKRARIAASEEHASELQKVLDTRLRRLHRLRESYQASVNTAFNAFLRHRGHTGSIIFDDSKTSLELEVQLDGGHQGGLDQVKRNISARDVKTLSGGEKSFSTVCFLLSMWELVESPFRALDEFDIFMDSIHRRTSMNLLIKTAVGKHRKRQLLILTPHDTSFIPVDDNIKIIRLRNPDRSGFQTSLHSYATAVPGSS